VPQPPQEKNPNPAVASEIVYDFGGAISAPNPGQVMGASAIADGILVLDSSDGRTVYMIADSGKKFGFTSETVFKKFGFSFNNLSKLDVSNVELGGLITENQLVHPDGSLVSDGKTVWFIQNGKRYGIPDMATFNAHNFDKNNIVPVIATDLSLPESSF